MDKSQIIHDLAVAAATVSVSHNYESEIMSEKPEHRRQQTADCIKGEYELFLEYFQKSLV